MIIDKLIEKINDYKNPSVIGIDTAFDYLPGELTAGCESLEQASDAIRKFNYAVIDAVCDIVPAVKVQVAYYEMYGYFGMKCFYDTLAYAEKKGMLVIADVKRNDIGSTAGCYSAAYIGKTKIGNREFSAFPSDFITVNGYLGSDGISPFTADCKKFNKGLFILVKTSNPSSGELQNKKYDNGKMLYEVMAEKVVEWGAELVGKYGYSSIGAVVGATKPVEAESIRNAHKNLYFLVPGYGAQGGGAADIMPCFDNHGCGAIVNSSRGILCAYKQDKYKGMSFDKAAREASLDMREDITSTLKEYGKGIK